MTVVNLWGALSEVFFKPQYSHGSWLLYFRRSPSVGRSVGRSIGLTTGFSQLVNFIGASRKGSLSMFVCGREKQKLAFASKNELPDNEEHRGEDGLEEVHALQAEALENRHYRLRHHAVVDA